MHVGDSVFREALRDLLETVDRDAQFEGFSASTSLLLLMMTFAVSFSTPGSIQRVQFTNQQSVFKTERGLVELDTVVHDQTDLPSSLLISASTVKTHRFLRHDPGQRIDDRSTGPRAAPSTGVGAPGTVANQVGDTTG